jgi:hypothetical protein
MGHVIADLPVGDVDRLEGLWRELLDHHLAAAPHLAALGDVRDPADSWRVRRAQYLQWLAVPRAAVLVARDADCLLGYAMVRAADAAGSWQCRTGSSARRSARTQDLTAARLLPAPPGAWPVGG